MGSFELAQEALSEKDDLRALAHLEAALAEMPQEDPRCDDYRCLMAVVLHRLGRLEEAEKLLQANLSGQISERGFSQGSSVGGLYALGELYREQGRLEEARHCLVLACEVANRAQLQDELAFQIEYSLAVVLGQSGLTMEALRHALAAFKLLPEGSPFASPLLNLSAELAIQQQGYELAGELFARLSELDQDVASRQAALASLSDMLMVQGRFEEALAVLKKLPPDPEETGVLRRIGVCQARLGEYAQAEATLLQAREAVLGALEKMELTRLLGDLQARQEHWQEAADRYQEARSWARSKVLKAQLRYDLGKMCLNLDREEEARIHFASAHNLLRRSDHPPRLLAAGALQQLGAIYNRRGEAQRSEKRLLYAMQLLEMEPPLEIMHPQRQLEMKQTSFAVLDELSRSLQLQGRMEEAIGLLEPLVSTVPTSERSTRLLELLDQCEDPARAAAWRAKLGQ